METVTFKLHEKLLKKIDKLLRPLNFNNRTEFIREAVREKLYKIETERLMRKLAQFKGAAMVKTSDEKLKEARENAVKRYAKDFGIDLD